MPSARLIACLALFCLPALLHAQGLLWATNFPRYRYSFEVTGSQHAVPGLAHMQHDTQQYLAGRGLPAQRLSSFPPYWGVRLNATRLTDDFESHRLGLSLGSSSTGSRLGYADASGSIVVDQSVAFRTLSLLFESDLFPAFNQYDRWSLEPALDARAGLTFMTMRQHERIRTGFEEQTSRGAYWSLLPTVEVGVALRAQRRQHFVQARAGYFATLPVPLWRRGDAGALFAGGERLLRTVRDGTLHNWDHGLRLSLSVGLQQGFE